MILVTGANGVVGAPLVEALIETNRAYLCVSRNAGSDQVLWDLHQPPTSSALVSIEQCDTLVHCAPIWLLAPHIKTLYQAGIKRMVVFSSTSVISKQASTDPQEQDLVRQLSEAEAAITRFAEHHTLTFTILRPSMIYGFARDENISHIARFIKKRRCMLLMGRANGLRQPVHASDLVAAVFGVLATSKANNQTYNLAGAEALSYREMVGRIFAGLGQRRIIVSLPLWLFRLGLKAASLLGRFNYTPEMANRMNQDLAYSNQKAIDDFAYAPQAFLQQPERDLP